MDDPSSSASTTATTVAVAAAAALLMTVAVYCEKFKKKPRQRNFLEEWSLASSFAIQYQSTGVDSLSLFDEIELK